MKTFIPLLTIVLLFFQHSISAQIHYVAPGGTGNGISWNDASGDLRATLETRLPGDEVWVATGTYYPDSTDREASFVIPSGVAVYGGFTGMETSRSERNPELNPTILSGAIGTDSDEDNSYSVVRTVNVSSTTLLDGCIIEDGLANGSEGGFDNLDRAGGGWHNLASNGNESSPTINNCIFRNNYAFGLGGGMVNIADYGATCTSVISNCIFENNICDNDGGALYNGGKVNGNCQPLITDCIFDNNTTGNGGGAIYNNGQDGRCNPIIDRCQIINNYSDYAGGGIYSFGKDGEADAQISNSLIIGNIAQFGGGGVYNLGNGTGSASPTVINCTFTLNSSVVGGAMYNNAGADDGTASPNITNCIFWNNPVSSGGSVFRANYGTPTISYSIVDVAECNDLNSGSGSNVTCGPGMQYNANPNFTPAFSIPVGSPAINSGDNVAINSLGLLLDLNQDTRIQNALVDLGATEIFSPNLDTDNDGIPDDTDNCPLIANADQLDADSDNFGTVCDCDDTEATVNENAAEICDGLDNNCDGNIDEGFDQDGDGFKVCDGDCDDNDPAIFPGATETCDGIDNNCNLIIDEGADPIARYPDMDGDLLGDASADPSFDCPPLPGYVENNSDCNDTNPFFPQPTGTLCNDGNPNTTGDMIQEDGCTCLGIPGTSGYCATLGMEPWVEWISHVNFGDIENSSFKEQYADFTGLTTDVSIGSTFPITIQADFAYPHFDEYIRIWIDFNQDADFEDDGELVLEAIHPTGPDGTLPPFLSGDIAIPTTATPGGTRMRISMKRDAYADPCESFDFGEVEDYSVNLINDGPVLTLDCPGEQTLTTPIGATTVNATWEIPTPLSNCPTGTATISQTAGLPPGSDFPIGVNTIAYEATDDCGNTETCSFDIIINDGGSAVLTLDCPAEQTLTTPIGATTVTATWEIPTPLSNCPTGTATISQTAGLPPGSDFPVGVNTIAYEATDDCGNTETCSCDIIINDGGSAVLTFDCPAEQTLTTPIGATTVTATWEIPTPLSNCPTRTATISQTAGLPPGSDFPIGVNTITYEATDDCGNTETCSFDIVVNDGGPTGNGYCASGADQPWVEWIGNVTLNDLNNSSTKSGYSDFTNLTANVNTGENYQLSVQPVFSYTHYTEYIQVWIDYNGNENFNDPGELVISAVYNNGTNGTAAVPVSENILIPTNAISGNTRMRVAMQRGQASTPCEIFMLGEVEDYTINITSNGPSLTLLCVDDFTITAGVNATSGVVAWNEPAISTTCPDESLNLIQISGPANGSTQPVGNYTITYEATDNCGNIETCSFEITIESQSAILTLNCPADQIISTLPGASTATASWTIPATDSDCPTGSTLLSQTAGLAPGDDFPVGVNTITYEATDDCGNIETCSFTITVNDGGVTTLSLDCPASQTLATIPGESTITTTWNTPVPITNCPSGITNILQTTGLNSGSSFPIGINTVTYEASDDCGNIETCSFTITVNDGGPTGNGYCESSASSPWVDWIGNVSLNDLNNNSNKSGYSDFTSLVANVDIGENYPITIQPAFSYTHFTEYIQVWIDFNQNESFADPGELVVSAIYANGINGTTASPITQNITIPNGALTGNTRMRVAMNRTEASDPCEFFEFGEVEDYTVNISNSGPNLTLNCSADLNISAGVGATTGVIAWNTPTASSTCPVGTTALIQTSGPANGSTQSVGTYTITYEATDDCGNIEDCTFTISLTSDPTAISISCPPNQTLTTVSGVTTALATWNIPTPVTSCPASLVTTLQIEGLPSGSDFPTGINTITYEASDDCGNIETCSFTITVNDGGPVGNGYCNSTASAPWQEWIGNVSLSNINNTSGKNGYGDFTAFTANVIKGESYDLSIQPVFSYTHFTEYFQVWIDFNGNENFNDPGELVISTVYENGINGTVAPLITGDITIPTDALTGTTRMRVTMSRNAAVGPCENFIAGEVEDYTINIGNAPLSAIVNTEVLYHLSAQAEARTVRLNWASNLDATTSSYTIERKEKDGEFTEIDQLPPYGESQQTHFYQYTDRSVTHGSYEYRIAAIQNNGSKLLTNIQAIDLGTSVNRLHIFPNPAILQVSFASDLLAEHSVNLMLTNSLGQVIHQKQYDATADQRIILDVSGYPNGIYLVRFQAGKRKAMYSRLVIERD